MTRRARLVRVTLSYADGMVLHTARSGAIGTLDELRLVVEQPGGLAALGSTRLNIAYLSGIEAEVLAGQCRGAADALDWQAPFASWTAQLDPALPPAARMLFEMAAADGAARAAGQPLSVWLGGPATAVMPSNQTLFRCDDATLLARAQAYVARGFLDLKLRIGFGPFGEDLHRLTLLRRHFGSALHLSADANGAWPLASAREHLAALAPLGLQYLEQPVITEDWEALGALSRASPVPIMLDESLSDMAAVHRLIATRAAPLAHLKLAKLGGLDRLMQAGRALAAAGIGVMVGQMNEGVVSTLAAAHAARALGVRLCELYGADGLADDPAGELHYAAGMLHLRPGGGLGLLEG